MRSFNSSRRGGFTLIELIFVIVILGILAAVAVPRFVGVQDDAKVSAEQGVIGGIRGGISVVQGKCLTKSWSGGGFKDTDGDGTNDANYTTKCFPTYLEKAADTAAATTVKGLATDSAIGFSLVLNEAPSGFTRNAQVTDSSTQFEGPASNDTSGVGATLAEVNTSGGWNYQNSLGTVIYSTM